MRKNISTQINRVEIPNTFGWLHAKSLTHVDHLLRDIGENQGLHGFRTILKKVLLYFDDLRGYRKGCRGAFVNF